MNTLDNGIGTINVARQIDALQKTIERMRSTRTDCSYDEAVNFLVFLRENGAIVCEIKSI